VSLSPKRLGLITAVEQSSSSGSYLSFERRGQQCPALGVDAIPRPVAKPGHAFPLFQRCLPSEGTPRHCYSCRALAVVTWGELAPHPPSLPGPWQCDKVDHVTAYFGLALSGTLGWGMRRSLLWVLLGVLAIGGSLEGLQVLVGRDAEWGDMFANTIGAVIGFGLACAYLAIPRRPAQPAPARGDRGLDD
jgi:VanZ family protein